MQRRILTPIFVPAVLTCLASFSFAQQDPLDDPSQKTSTGILTEVQPENRTLEFLYNGEAPSSMEELKSMERRFAELTDKVFPATVNIQLGSAQGSGVVVSSDGFILTAAHVIGDPGGVATVVFPDGSRYFADTLGVSAGRIDSGMLKIRNKDAKTFPSIDLGISEGLKKGQWVMAIGHPGGFDRARGLVARVGRIVYASDKVLRTDCTLVGGDSGGPLVDMEGNLIGIHSRIGSTLADNLHVPVDQYSLNWDKLAEGLILSGRPSLGFGVLNETNRVESVNEGKSAEEAGMKVNDVIVSIEGIRVSSKEEISEALKELNLYPNQKIEIIVVRDEKEVTLQVVVGNRS